MIVIDSITSLIAPILGGIKKPNLTQYPQRQGYYCHFIIIYYSFILSLLFLILLGHALMVEISRLIKEIAVNHDVVVLVRFSFMIT